MWPGLCRAQTVLGTCLSPQPQGHPSGATQLHVGALLWPLGGASVIQCLQGSRSGRCLQPRPREGQGPRSGLRTRVTRSPRRSLAALRWLEGLDPALGLSTRNLAAAGAGGGGAARGAGNRCPPPPPPRRARVLRSQGDVHTLSSRAPPRRPSGPGASFVSGQSGNPALSWEPSACRPSPSNPLIHTKV